MFWFGERLRECWGVSSFGSWKCRGRSLLLWIGLMVPCSLSAGTEGGESPAIPPARELLGQVVNIDRSDYKAKGRIALHRLQPLAGQLILSEARGNPDWIFKTIAPWNPGLARLLDGMKIEELTLTDADLLLDGPTTLLKLGQAAIPEGRVERVDYRQEAGGVWRVESGAVRFDRLPSGLSGVLMALSGAVGLDRLEASGDRERGTGWAGGVFGPGWQVARLDGSGEVTGRDDQGRPARGVFRWTAAGTQVPGLRDAAKQVPELAGLLRFAGRDPHSAESVALGKVAMRVESKGQGTFLIQELRVDAPWVQLQGEGALETRGGQGKERLRLALSAKNRTGQEKRFKIDLPLASLVKR
ncbi:MAG: hypothetical protein HQM00_15295 [Magnetococcales bacterium]|nr:hypothetical protein [Magnetococcales bacterium]